MDEMEHTYIPTREFIEQRLDAMDKALILQALEYQRRLEALNHEAQQLKDMQATYTRQEIYDSQKSSLESDIRQLRDYMNRQKGQLQVFALSVSTIAVLLSSLVSVIFSKIHF